MCMTLILDYWETVSLTAGCNLYSTHFRLCVLTVRGAHQAGNANPLPGPALLPAPKDTNMYFRERDKPVVDAETFLATSVPKILIASLIIFLNVVAITAMCRSHKWVSYGRQKGFYILPQSTQGLLHSLFVAYLILGLLTLYSQISLSLFVLGEYRIFEDQGTECLTVNSLLIALSLAIALHLVSLSVDRTLASYLPYAKYTSLSKGTLPLWLLSIWLPSLILGALPLAGWKSNFSFCIFMHQFKDDYLRFVSAFFLTTIFLIPCLYIFFVTVLKPRQHVRILYRWHRKLQAHHRLTFALVLVVNIICWTPFHSYLLMACLSCSYAYLASGFTLEYLYMLALVPSILIPLMFSIRSSSMDKCANKISKCVQFLEPQNHNPLANVPKSPLFSIDDAIQQHQREQEEKRQRALSSGGTHTTSSTRPSSNRHSRKTLPPPTKNTLHQNPILPNARSKNTNSFSNSFFTTPYLPPLTQEERRQRDYDEELKHSGQYALSNNQYANASLRHQHHSQQRTNNEYLYEKIRTIPNPPFRNFCAYLNSKNTTNQSPLSSDSKYGFPILPPRTRMAPPIPPNQRTNN